MRTQAVPGLGPSSALAGPRLSRWPVGLQRLALTAYLVLTDAVALAAGFRIAYWIRFEQQITVAPEVVASPAAYQGLTGILIPLWLLVFFLFNLYDRHAKLGGILESSATFQACTMATMLVVVGTFLFPSFTVSRMWLVSVWLLSFLAVATSRFVARRVVYAFRRRGYLLRPALIVGANEEATSLAACLGDWQSSGVWTLGFVSRGEADDGVERLALPVLGTVGDIQKLIGQHGIEDVIVAITALSREELLRLFEDVDPLAVQLRISSGVYELLTTRVQVHTLGTVPLMSLQKNRLDPGEAVIKACLDCAVAFLGLLALSPLLVAIGAWIKWDSPGPVFYRRRVLGARGRQFDAFKFRTMYVNGDLLLKDRPDETAQLRDNHKLKQDPRITPAGRWLRKFSLDELPQLMNVLLGQMSLVGPRMISPAEAEKYGRHRFNLLSVKPGITGLWQVSGRSDLTYEERVRIDMYYVRNYSIWLDLQILFVETVPAVLRGHGAY
jgi:exopolysaccharide biosynthesis polyprenyl glycosylphosphotransferase